MPCGGRQRTRAAIGAAVLFATLLALCGLVSAQTGQPTQCGPTSIGTAAASVVFPVSGGHGPSVPNQYLSISTTGTANYLCVRADGTAAATSGSGCAAGNFYVGPLAPPLTWAQPNYAPPSTVSIVGSASSTPVTCAYQ